MELSAFVPEEIRTALAKLPHPGDWIVIDFPHKRTGMRVFGIGWKTDDGDSDWVMTIESGDHDHAQAICDIINRLAKP